MVNRVFACTWPPFAPLKVNKLFKGKPESPLIDPDEDDDTVMELEALVELAEHVTFPS